ncbi:chaperone protein dnaJ 8, chloroplastic-like isoform X2 [Macadamia integrifolia]|uniref:chaperone protein dnaJ 8, chloroplastic-like isoform X2 n=1 Tax=Macadamia integrifolia TaxID=60698 RepID=UPI001C5023B1|nr:chaperone protein dnaJ 8, chloroplastic-like isoform X2 [Macadamia integrifolia]
MAMAVGLMSGGGVGGSSSASSAWALQRGFLKNKKAKRMNYVSCVASSARLTDQYKTLRIQPGASEGEVKKAFRQLALQYHPDVCKGNNCGVQFNQINEAYDVVMSYLRGEETNTIGDQYESSYYDDADEPMRGMCDPDWDMWEEWMGWEGAGIRDYSSHINPYI